MTLRITIILVWILSGVAVAACPPRDAADLAWYNPVGAAEECTPWLNGDLDGDGITADNCPRAFNPSQRDRDADGLGDVCDPCPTTPNWRWTDGESERWPLGYLGPLPDHDADGVADGCDDDDDDDGVVNSQDDCRWVADPRQVDSDFNGIGDACDADQGPVERLVDTDQDGVPDAVDNCPQTVNPRQFDGDGDGLGAACDDAEPVHVAPADTDRDGVPDGVDACPLVADAQQRDLDGDGRGDACDDDDDGDDRPDIVDPCPLRHGTRCGADDDGDGTPAPFDLCPQVASGHQNDADGDGIGDVCDADPGFAPADADGDGKSDALDNCPDQPNPGQADLDEDGRGDACDADRDGDDVEDNVDDCPDVFDPDQIHRDLIFVAGRCVGRSEPAQLPPDADEDGVPDAADNCVEHANRRQLDANRDGIGDACSLDDDADGVPDINDLCVTTFDPDQFDLDSDGVGDACDPDDDGDGVPDVGDICPRVVNAAQRDTDADGFGDACDTCPVTASHDNQDADADGLGNPCDPDADGDGVPDRFDECPAVPNPLQDTPNCDGVLGECVAQAEVCNFRDDDCDGTIDEGTGVVCSVEPMPGCALEGELVCAGGALRCDAAHVTELCNAIDDDCDGVVDEDPHFLTLNLDVVGDQDPPDPDPNPDPGPDGGGFGGGFPVEPIPVDPDPDDPNPVEPGVVHSGATCVLEPLPECVLPGIATCTDGEEACVPLAVDEECDGEDNDCDGHLDEAIVGGACSAGDGICAAEGVLECTDGAFACAAELGVPGDEVCDDGIDSDCDGQVDEGCCTAVFVAERIRKLNANGVQSGRPSVAATATEALISLLDDDGETQAARDFRLTYNGAGRYLGAHVGRLPGRPSRLAWPPASVRLDDELWRLTTVTEGIASGGMAVNRNRGLEFLGTVDFGRTPAPRLARAHGTAATVAVTWYDLVEGEPRLRWLVSDSAAVIRSGPFDILTVMPDSQWAPNVNIRGAEVGLSWEAPDGIYFAVFDLDGGVIAAPRLVTEDAIGEPVLVGGAQHWLMLWPSAIGVTGARLTIDDSLPLGVLGPTEGAIDVIEKDGGYALVAPMMVDAESVLTLTALTAGGEPEGPPLRVHGRANESANHPSIAWTGERYVIAWQSDLGEDTSSWVLHGTLQCEEDQ